MIPVNLYFEESEVSYLFLKYAAEYLCISKSIGNSK
jgi:hypothetical protein